VAIFAMVFAEEEKIAIRFLRENYCQCGKVWCNCSQSFI